MDVTDRGYWRHTGSGQIWAVETNNAHPVRCAGPLRPEDLDRELLPHLDYTTSYVGPLQAEWQSYEPQDLCSSCGAALTRGSAVTPDGRAHLSCSA